MLIYEVLKKDHQKLQNIMDEIDETANQPAAEQESGRSKLLGTMKNILLAHAKTEEAIFYKSIIDQPATHDLTMEALEEHKQAERLLLELEDLAPGDERWMSKFKTLRAGIEHHIEEEEKEMFKKAKKVLTKDEAEEMGSEFKDLKVEVMEELGVH